LDGIEVLVYGEFAAAARRRFSPAWTSADIVRFVADFRSSSAEVASLTALTASFTPHELDGLLTEGRTLADSLAAADR